STSQDDVRASPLSAAGEGGFPSPCPDLPGTGPCGRPCQPPLEDFDYLVPPDEHPRPIQKPNLGLSVLEVLTEDVGDRTLGQLRNNAEVAVLVPYPVLDNEDDPLTLPELEVGLHNPNPVQPLVVFVPLHHHHSALLLSEFIITCTCQHVNTKGAI